MNITQLKAQYAQDQAELKGLVSQYPMVKGEDGSDYRDIPKEKRAEVDALVGRLDSLGEDIKFCESIENYTRPERVANRLEVAAEKANYLAERKGFINQRQDWVGVKSPSGLTAEVKSVINGTNNPLRAQMEADIVPFASRPVQLLDFFPFYATQEDSIVYRRQTARTNNAKTKLEGQALEASTFTTEIVTEAIRVIGHAMDITEQEFADDSAIAMLMQMELPMMVRQEFDRQLAVGAGTGSELAGLQDLAGAQTRAAGSDPKVTVIRKAIKQVRITGRANPNLVIMHPDDWEKVVEDQASDGHFLINILQDQVAPRIAGLRVIECDAITAGKPMVVDTSFFPIALRQDVTVDFTNSDGEKFAQLIRTARAYVRAGIKHRRPAALCGVTGF
jgi:hypothetical protein